MTFPTTGILDDFNRSNGAIGSAWTTGVFGEVTTWSVASNQAAGSGSFNSTWWNGAQFGPDAEVYATLAVVPAVGNLAYLGVRTQTPGSSAADGYELVITKNAGTDTINLYRVLNSGQTSIGSFSQEVSAGDSVGIEAIGSTITVYYKAAAGGWTSLGSATDATYSTGYIFMGMQGTAGRWDDFGGGTVVGGGPAGQPATARQQGVPGMKLMPGITIRW